MNCLGRFRIARVLTLLCLAAAVAVPASGSTFVDMDLNEIVAQSQAAVEGRVAAVESFWDETGTVIVSEAVIEVDRKLYGRAGSQVVIRTFGGEVDGYTVEAVGFPSFEPDERVLVFVDRPETPDGRLRVTGYQLGLYKIVEQGGESVAIPKLDDGARFVSPDGGRANPPAARSLDELESQILSAARAQRKVGR